MQCSCGSNTWTVRDGKCLTCDGCGSARPGSLAENVLSSLYPALRPSAKAAPAPVSCRQCSKHDADAKLVPCGHKVLCARCADAVLSKPCPACGVVATDYTRPFVGTVIY